MKITIEGWDKYNPRKDFKQPKWFAFSNRLIEDSDFFDFDPLEFKAWIYLMSQASQKNCPNLDINFEHANKVCEIPRDAMLSSVKKLLKIGVISSPERIRTRSVRETNGSVQETNSTLHYITEQTGQNRTNTSTSSPIVSLWNSLAHKNLSRVVSVSKKRIAACNARWAEHPDEKFWIDGIELMNQSPFLIGEKALWKASFDWFIKPDSIIKITEGQYSPTGSQKPKGIAEILAEDRASEAQRGLA